MPRYFINQDGKVVAECVVEHPANPDGYQIITVSALPPAGSGGTSDDGVPFTVPLPPAPTERDYTQAIQLVLDAEARGKGYDNIVSACSYAAIVNPFQAEAISFLEWRSAVWAYGYEQLALVQAGTRPQPTVAQLVSELPARVVP